jgi:hypothetical protein
MNVDPGIRQAMLGLEQQVSKGGLNINLEWTEALTLVADRRAWHRRDQRLAARTVPGGYVPRSLETSAAR